MKIAILTRPDNKSPKIMAQALKKSLGIIGVQSDIFFSLDTLSRLVPFSEPTKGKTKLHFRIRRRLKYYFKDKILLKKLKEYDVIIISECIPNGFWKGYYALPQLKKIVKKPLGIWEVYFLDAAPNSIKELTQNNDYLQDIYDFHLALSKVSYIKTETSNNKFELGLNLKDMGLKPSKKETFFVLIDFKYKGNEKNYAEQIAVLDNLKIPYKKLEGTYNVEEIRELYKNASVFFMQHYESFGLPIAECLAFGTKIFTPDSSWPCAFRLDENPEPYGKGVLANCFEVYETKKDLSEKIIAFKQSYNNEHTPKMIFKSFINNYPSFYYGNSEELKRFIKSIPSF